MANGNPIFSFYNRLSPFWRNAGSFLLLLAVFTALPLTGFQIYEPASDPSFVAVFKGVFSNAHGRLSNNDGNWIFLQYILRFLYTHFPDGDWYGITMIFFCTLGSFVYLQIVRMVYSESVGSSEKLFRLLLFAAIYVLFFVSVAILEFTRVAGLLSFLGLLLIVYTMRRGAVNRGYYLLGLFTFLMGCFVRNQPAILSTLLISPLVFLYLKRKEFSFKKVVKYFALPGLFLFLTAAFSSVGWDKSWDKTLEYGGYLINIWDFNLPKEKVMLKNKADSLTYQVVSDFHFINDPQNINPEFFERVGVPYTDKKVSSIPTILSNKIDHYKKIKTQGIAFIVQHAGGSLLFLGIVMLAAFGGAPKKQGVHWPALALFAFYLLVYFLIAVFLKMEHRVVSPMLFSCSLAMALLIDAKNSSDKWFKVAYIVIIVFLIGFAAIELVGFKTRFNKFKSDADATACILQAVSKRQEPYIFLEQLVMRSYNYPLQPDPLSKSKSYPTIDNIAFFIDPTYNAKMKQITGGDSMPQYLDFVARHPQQCLFVSDSARINGILNYFNYMYHLKLRAESVPSGLGPVCNAPVDGFHLDLYKVTY